MRQNKTWIFQTASLISGYILLALLARAEEPYQLVESHPVAETSNSAEVNLLFNQTGVSENYRLEFYNSNPDTPVLVVDFTEHETIGEPERFNNGVSDQHSTLWVGVQKYVRFYPKVLSENRVSPPLVFDYINPPKYLTRFLPEEHHEQSQVNYRTGIVWNSNTLILTFQQNWEKPQQIDLTKWAERRSIKLSHVPKITRIDVLARHNPSYVTVKNDFQISEALGLSIPLWERFMGADKKVLDTPGLFIAPDAQELAKVLVDTAEKIREDNAYLIYMLTPYVNQDGSEEDRQLARELLWRTTTPEQDAIYDDGMRVLHHSFSSKEWHIQIDDRHNEINRPKVRYVIDRHIYFRPKDPANSKYWLVGSRMSTDIMISNFVCEYEHGQKSRCTMFSSAPLQLGHRLVFISRDAEGNIKAYLGPSEYEHLSLSQYFPDLSLAGDLEFSEEYKEFTVK